MHIRGKILVVCVIACVAMLTAVSVADAQEWFVEGKPLSGSTEINKVTRVRENLVLAIPSVKASVVCSAVAFEHDKILYPELGEYSKIPFFECRVSEPTTCSLGGAMEFASASAITEAGVGSLTTTKIKPKVGELLGEIEFLGSMCPLFGRQALKGKITATDPEGKIEKEWHRLKFKSEGELKAGGLAVTFKGEIEQKLASADLWGFH